jgi:hypothetical protein
MLGPIAAKETEKLGVVRFALDKGATPSIQPRTRTCRQENSSRGAMPRVPAPQARVARAETALRRGDGSPWHLSEAAQYRVYFAGIGAEAPALDFREHVALEHDIARQRPRTGVWSSAIRNRLAHHSAARGKTPAIHWSRSLAAREHNACFLAVAFAGPRIRLPPVSWVGACVSGMKRPKFTFIG